MTALRTGGSVVWPLALKAMVEARRPARVSDVALLILFIRLIV